MRTRPPVIQSTANIFFIYINVTRYPFEKVCQWPAVFDCNFTIPRLLKVKMERTAHL